jgi:hypothetical protein
MTAAAPQRGASSSSSSGSLVKDAVCLSLAFGHGVRDTASATVRGLGSLAGAATRKGLHTFQVSTNPLDV